jgi:hypothetical protein
MQPSLHQFTTTYLCNSLDLIELNGLVRIFSEKFSLSPLLPPILNQLIALKGKKTQIIHAPWWQ